MRGFLGILIGLIGLSFSSFAQEAELETVIEVNEILQDFTQKAEVTQSELSALLANDDTDPKTGKKFSESDRVKILKSRLRDQRGRVFEKRAEYKAALSAYRKKMEPTVSLYNEASEALKTINAIQDQGNDDIKRSKAVARATILRDMNALISGVSQEYTEHWTALENAIKYANTSSDVAEVIKTLFEDDPLSKEVAGLYWSISGNEILKSVTPERINDWNSGLKKFGFAIKLTRVYAGEVDAKPLDSQNFERLIMLTDLVGSVPGGEAIGLKLFSVQSRMMLENMRAHISSLNHSAARSNLVALIAEANKGTIACPHPEQLTSDNVLFGKLVRFPYVDVDNPKVKLGETITGKWCSGLDFDSDAWLGIIMADRHFKMEENQKSEPVNDAHDKDYITVGDKIGGDFNFVTSAKWPTGAHYIRMFDDDDGGNLVIDKTIELTGCGQKKYFTIPKTKYVQDEDITVSFCNLDYDLDADNGFITIVPADKAKGQYDEWYYTQGPQGALTFSNNILPKTYEIRYHNNYNDNDYKIFDKLEFEVVGKPWLEGYWRVKEGDYSGMEIRFGKTSDLYSGHVTMSTSTAINKYLSQGMLMFRNYEIKSSVSAWGDCKSYYTSHKFKHFGISYHAEDDEISVNCPDSVRLERVKK